MADMLANAGLDRGITEVARKSGTGSAVTNGTRLHISPIPGSGTAASRRFADLKRQLEDERGGAAALTVTQREAIRAYCLLAVRHEQAQAAVASGQPIDDEVVGKMGDRMCRQIAKMGPVKAAERLSLRDRFAKRGTDEAAA